MADLIKKGVHGCTREELYVAPSDPVIQERLEWFRDQKLALMMHFGPYAQMGVDCSWPLSEQDSWARKLVDWEADLDVFREQYINLNKSFNPFHIQPDKWAEFAKENGFKYLIFTTKHHDGFCMFDTKYTDYKITSLECPFHTHKYANIVRSVFDAFRNDGLAIAAYFSKPDWHCPWYWAKGMEKPWGKDRHPTYNPQEHPDVWEKYIEFTHNQMAELLEEYGKIDILWLDGGQVKPQCNQDIRMDEFVERARKIQPSLIVVDRTVGGANENYITPEQSIPDRVINVPWESCVTLGTRWCYRYNDTYKTSREMVKMLAEVVSRGGNLAINIGPQPDGRLPERALNELRGLGKWLKINGDAIYGTRALEVPQIENVMFTKKDDVVYAIVPFDEGVCLENTLKIFSNKQVESITCLGFEASLGFVQSGSEITVTLPSELVGKNPFAVSFAMK